MLTSRLAFARSEAQPTLFVDLARNVFIAGHVDDLIMVGSSSQLYEVVGEMKQYFTMKVTHPLSASSTQTYVGARYLRHGDAIWELPTARYVTGMLNEHGDEDEEASAEEHRSVRRTVGKSQFFVFATNRLARSGKTLKVGHHCVEASPAIAARYAGSRTEAASAKQSVLSTDSAHRKRLGWRSTHAQVRVFVGNHAGWILDQCRCPNTVSDCSIVMRS